MGITRESFELCARLVEKNLIEFNNINVLELGAQNIHFYDQNFVSSFLSRIGRTDIDTRSVYAGMTGAAFHQLLGNQYNCIDFDDLAGQVSPLRWDLNTKKCPEDFRSTVDVITNFGTSEHLLNQSNCFELCHDLLKVGGVVINIIPYARPDHGFFNYNPSFFSTLAESNGYEILGLHFSPDIGGWELKTLTAFNGIIPTGSEYLHCVYQKKKDQPFSQSSQIYDNGLKRSKTLYVSCLYDLYNLGESDELKETENWSVSWLTRSFRYKQIEWLFSCDINLLLFVQEDLLGSLPRPTGNVRIIPYKLNDIDTYWTMMNSNLPLPAIRELTKDTMSYFALMNSKLDFIKIAKTWYPSDRYTWIDASIFKLFKNKDNARTMINYQSLSETSNLITSPSGSDKIQELVIDRPNWRFLGSIITIPDDKFDMFYDKSHGILVDEIAQGRIMWEVNIWAEVERRYPELFWIYANSYMHDETMLQKPYKI
jgi:hypothetical protein